MSKYRILAVPDVSPGKCANCGSSKNDGRGYVDFGLHVDWYGAVYLCGSCLHDIAKAMGLFSELEELLEKALSDKDSLEKIRQEGKDLHEGVQNSIDGLRDYYERIFTHRIDPSPGTTTHMVVDTGASSKSTTDGPEQGVVKSTSSTGREDLSNFTELFQPNGN